MNLDELDEQNYLNSPLYGESTILIYYPILPFLILPLLWKICIFIYLRCVTLCFTFDIFPWLCNMQGSVYNKILGSEKNKSRIVKVYVVMHIFKHFSGGKMKSRSQTFTTPQATNVVASDESVDNRVHHMAVKGQCVGCSSYFQKAGSPKLGNLRAPLLRRVKFRAF